MFEAECFSSPSLPECAELRNQFGKGWACPLLPDETAHDRSASQIAKTQRRAHRSGVFPETGAAIACFSPTSKCPESYRYTSGSAEPASSKAAVPGPEQRGPPERPHVACPTSRQHCDMQASSPLGGCNRPNAEGAKCQRRFTLDSRSRRRDPIERRRNRAAASVRPPCAAAQKSVKRYCAR